MPYKEYSKFPMLFVLGTVFQSLEHTMMQNAQRATNRTGHMGTHERPRASVAVDIVRFHQLIGQSGEEGSVIVISAWPPAWTHSAVHSREEQHYGSCTFTRQLAAMVTCLYSRIVEH